MSINQQHLIADLEAAFPGEIRDVNEPYGLLGFSTTPQSIMPILSFLYNHDIYRFQFLTDLCGVHYPDQKTLAVVYHVHSLENNFRLRIKVFLPEGKPQIPTASTLFRSANWQERETYDFYGIIFEGHPNLRRILNVDDMVAFPMRKEFPLEDPNRVDKDDSFFGR
jgi:NADH-quinone oxidoreductase subunit C